MCVRLASSTLTTVNDFFCMKKTVALLIAIVLLGSAAYYFLGAGAVDDQGDAFEDEAMNTSDSSAMRAEENMVVVSEQRPGRTVTGSIISLAAPGYLVIHEDNNGAPGAVLGSSALLQAGESTEVKVTLSRASRDGETLHAMLHFEKGGNTTFAAAEDTPVPSSLGGPISGWFEISSEASMDLPVSI